MNGDGFVDREISKAQMRTSGWGVDSYVSSNPFECDFFYIFDYQLGLSKLLSVQRSTFDELVVSDPIDRILPTIGVLVKRWSKKGLSGVDMNLLAIALVGYFKQTRSYFLYREQGDLRSSKHIVLNIYRNPVDASLNVRPFMIKSSAPIEQYELVLRDSRSVFEMDRERNPSLVAGVKDKID